eukprot:CAMPEP_0197733574 /NCGR_PEP_ID=MMETSP1434-20131217/43968_1 /TAXON_ID=265543 /ORGANISM="Minutocellus polymorphus, Strain CCMP3303" /LENGTH=140 /DNA_ID=CAMNT_0043320949 /DNA_START=36 /DNA_END=458 /DNA_ORIENTATION=-
MMRPVALSIAALCLLFGQTTAFGTIGPVSRSMQMPTTRMAADDEKDAGTTIAAAAPLEEVDEDGNAVSSKPESKWALDERYEVKEDDSPLMKVGKALKPLNDVVETVTSSPLLGPVLFLAPILGNSKVRAEIANFFAGSQ